MSQDCHGTHRYFVADVAVVEEEGKVCVIVICTSCGDSQMKVFSVTRPNGEFYLIKQKEKESHVTI